MVFFLFDSQVISTTTLVDLPKSASYLPIRGDAKDISITALRSSLGIPGSSTNSLKKTTSTGDLTGKTNETSANGRRLRQRQDKSVTTDQKSKMQQTTSSDVSILPQASNSLAFGSCSIPGSPIKGAVPETLSDLQTSLNMYFGGVANRIANGERFAVRGKRVSLDGRVQYLIEWEGVS